MSTSLWARTVALVRDHIVLIETPGGHGTGFIVPTPPGSSGSCVVTAWHVVSHADKWRQPIKVTHFPSGKQAFLGPDARMISAASARDQAFVIFSAKDIPLPSPHLPLAQVDTRYNEGVEIGWLGFPNVAPSTLCFFCGHISAWLEQEEAYLVDGVAINGVSGGPAFFQDDKENPIIIGLVTAYRPNLANAQALPGVSLVRSINPFQKHCTQMQQAIAKAKVQDIPPEQQKNALSAPSPAEKPQPEASSGESGVQ